MKETKVAQDKSNTAFDSNFVKHDVRVCVSGGSNSIELLSNNHYAEYTVVLTKGKPSLRLVERGKAYR